MKKFTNLFLKTLIGIFIAQISTAQQTVQFSSSKLPICIIDTKGQQIIDDPKITAGFKIIYNGPGQINNITDNNYVYNNAIGIELRGNSSQSFAQLQYGIETKDSVTGENLDVSLLGMPEDNDWVLYAPYNDISMIRNVMAYHLWDKMDHWGPRTRMCELVLNGEYKGVYVLLENIKKSDGRVKIASLKAEDIDGLELTGGYIVKIDAQNDPEDKSFTSKVPGIKSQGQGGFNNDPTVTFLVHYPKSKDIQPQQLQYIQAYIDTVEAVIQSPEFADPVKGYAKYISTQSFIDYFIHTELSKNGDGFKRSAYFYKEKLAEDGSKGKLKAGPVWDFNLAYGNVNFCGGNLYTGWVYEGCETLPVPALWKRLLEDPNFFNAVKCRYQELRKGILSEQYLNSFIDKYALDSLQEAQTRQFTKYPELFSSEPATPGGGFGGGFGGGGNTWFFAYRVTSYSQEIDTLKTWLKNRLNWLDQNLGGTVDCSELTSVKYGNSSNVISLYPNPTSGSFTLEANSNIQNIEIMDAFGKKVDAIPSLRIGSKINYNGLQKFSDGFYYLKYDVDGITHHQKIIKNN